MKISKKEEDEGLLSKNIKDVDVEVTYKTHPDGEWGWVVVAAAFMAQFVILGLQNSSGVIFNEMVKKFDASRGATGNMIKDIFFTFKFIATKGQFCH